RPSANNSAADGTTTPTPSSIASSRILLAIAARACYALRVSPSLRRSRMSRTSARSVGLSVLALFLVSVARADPAMCLFPSPPAKQLKDRYDFVAEQDWLTHLQQSSVRFPRGSGSFVSPDGLVMTNHHVGRDTLVKLGTKERNIARDGFYAKTQADE